MGDGSYYESRNICTCGWIISTPDSKEWIKGGGALPGMPEDLHSYRGELGSLVGIANCLEALRPVLPSTGVGIVSASDRTHAKPHQFLSTEVMLGYSVTLE